MLARANRIAGGVNGWVADAKHYFSLGAENRELLARVGALETELSRYRRAETQALLDEYVAGERKAPYEFVAASVVANSINKDRNFLVFDRGRRNGVLPGMAVLSPGGAMVGYVAECSGALCGGRVGAQYGVPCQRPHCRYGLFRFDFVGRHRPAAGDDGRGCRSMLLPAPATRW